MRDSQFRLDAPWTAADAYREIERAAALPDVKRLALAHRASLQPVDRPWLKKRLSAMMLAFGHERDPDRVAAWLAETGRLLVDLPGDILATAIDEAIKRSERGFMPAVGQIRAVAEPLVEQREREARRLETLAGMVDAGGPPRPRPWEASETFDPATRCAADAASAILREFGLTREPKRKPKANHDGPPRAPTAAELAEVAAAMRLPAAEEASPPMPALDQTARAEPDDYDGYAW